jgi:hypothetical protein
MATSRNHPASLTKSCQRLVCGLVFLGAFLPFTVAQAAEVSFREAAPEQTWHLLTDNVLVRKWPVIYDTAAARRGNVQAHLSAGTSVHILDTRGYKRWKKIKVDVADAPVEGWVESRDVQSAMRVE